MAQLNESKAVYDLNNNAINVDTSRDHIAVKRYTFGRPGGVTVELNGFTGPVIKAGHVVITTIDEDGILQYLLLPVVNGAYVTLPEGHSYAGVVFRSVSALRPTIALMTAGTASRLNGPYQVTPEIEEAFKGSIIFV